MATVYDRVPPGHRKGDRRLPHRYCREADGARGGLVAHGRGVAVQGLGVVEAWFLTAPVQLGLDQGELAGDRPALTDEAQDQELPRMWKQSLRGNAAASRSTVTTDASRRSGSARATAHASTVFFTTYDRAWTGGPSKWLRRVTVARDPRSARDA